MSDRPHVYLLGDAHSETFGRLEFLSSMLKRRFEVTEISLTSTCPNPSSITALSAAVADEIGEDTNTHLVGFGLGACVAAIIASAQPEALQSVTLVAGWLTAPPKMQAVTALLRACKDDNLRERTFELITTSSFGWLDRTPLSNAMSMAHLELGITVDLSAEALRLRIPTLVIACDRDEFATPEQAQLLFGAIPNARFAVIPSGHNVLSERPAQLLSLIEPFVLDPEAQRPGTTFSELQP